MGETGKTPRNRLRIAGRPNNNCSQNFGSNYGSLRREEEERRRDEKDEEKKQKEPLQKTSSSLLISLLLTVVIGKTHGGAERGKKTGRTPTEDFISSRRPFKFWAAGRRKSALKKRQHQRQCQHQRFSSHPNQNANVPVATKQRNECSSVSSSSSSSSFLSSCC